MRDDLPDKVRDALGRLPGEPGCYRFLDGEGRVLYVGKARSLRQRVRSYFQPGAQHPPRIAALVAEVREIDVVVTRSELEALVLENNLIKEHRPRYNVLLRDDKEYPWLKLTLGDEFPRVVLVRRPRADGALYFGPFLPASHARRTLRMVPRFFGVANCHLRFDGRQRPCLLWHLDQCLAPCAGKADREEYRERVEQVRLFLEGRDRELRARLEERMREASARLEFERAARYRDMVRSLARLTERQGMISAEIGEADFWAEHRAGERAMLELFRMREGRVIGRREFPLDPAPPPGSLFDTVLPQFYGDEAPPREIVLPRRPADPELLERFLASRRGGPVRIVAPRQGERRRFLDLVARNARLAFEARFLATHRGGVAALEALRDLLGLDEAPRRIEAVDASHFQGSEPRVSLVVFEGGRPRKSEYRLYRPRGARPGDDHAALAEVLGRRVRRLLREGRKLPDAVLVDGGRGQLAAAVRALREAGAGDLPVLSLAKREEEIYLPGKEEPLRLDRGDPLLHLLQQLRDEAHRFAVRGHRRARSRAEFRTVLAEIPGVGPVTARRLLAQFGSVDGVRRATEEALAAAVGPARARRIREWFGREEPRRPGPAN